MKHKYPSKAQLRKLCNKEGPLAAAAAEGGGTLIKVSIPRIRKVGRGCGALTPVPATAGKVPCGAFLNWPDGERTEHLCYNCEEIMENKPEIGVEHTGPVIRTVARRRYRDPYQEPGEEDNAESEVSE